MKLLQRPRWSARRTVKLCGIALILSLPLVYLYNSLSPTASFMIGYTASGNLTKSTTISEMLTQSIRMYSSLTSQRAFHNRTDPQATSLSALQSHPSIPPDQTTATSTYPSHTTCRSEANTTCLSEANTTCRSESNTTCRSEANTTCGNEANTTCRSEANTTCRNEANTTYCDHCLRPSVRLSTNTIKEIDFQPHLTQGSPPDFFTPPTTVVQGLVTGYLVEPRLDCPYLLAVQPSVLDRRSERDTVRSTWGSVAREQTWPNRKINAKVKVIFVVASQVEADKNKDRYTRQLQEVRSEAEQHDDILYLDLVDNYKMLTLKLLSAFKWVKDNCPCVKFVLKVDYDTFVNVPLLVDNLLYFENRFNFSILGFIYMERNPVFRRGRWQIARENYPMKSFPEYASGCGYVLSQSALCQIVDKAPYFPLLPVEDAFITGIMRRVTGCKLFSLGDKFTEWKDKNWNLCQIAQDRKMLGTNIDAAKHNTIWESFVSNSCT